MHCFSLWGLAVLRFGIPPPRERYLDLRHRLASAEFPRRCSAFSFRPPPLPLLLRPPPMVPWSITPTHPRDVITHEGVKVSVESDAHLSSIVWSLLCLI